MKFNDGTPLNAEAMKYSLDRHREMKGSSRRSELDHVDAVEVVDPATVRLKLKAPFSPSRRSSPTARACRCRRPRPGNSTTSSGPRRCASARGRLSSAWPRTGSCWKKSTHYFDPGQAKFDRLVFRIITDDNVRLANLRSGDIDFMHLVNPTHAASLRKEGKFDVASVPGIGYQGFNINLRNKNGKPPAAPGDLGTPLANDPGCGRRSSCRSTARR